MATVRRNRPPVRPGRACHSTAEPAAASAGQVCKRRGRGECKQTLMANFSADSEKNKWSCSAGRLCPQPSPGFAVQRWHNFSASDNIVRAAASDRRTVLHRRSTTAHPTHVTNVDRLAYNNLNRIGIRSDLSPVRVTPRSCKNISLGGPAPSRSRDSPSAGG